MINRLQLRTVFRNLLKNRTYTFLNILGLGVGMAGAMVIYQLIMYHTRTDQHHAKADRTYRVVVDLHLDDGTVEHEHGSAFILHDVLKKEFSSVENAGYLASREVTVHAGEGNKFLEREAVGFANTDFFEIFDYNWISGTSKALDAPNQVVLTERYARKYFGEVDVIGKQLKLDNQVLVTVAGIVRDPAASTDFDNEVFVSLPTIKQLIPNYGYADWSWIDNGRETYITLKSASQKAAFASQLPAFSKKYYGDLANVYRYHLQDLSDVHFNLDYGGKIRWRTIYMLATVGLLLVLIACFNFINLAIAQASKRNREIGIRKVLGVSRSQVFQLFMSETAILVVLATVVSVAFLTAAVPVLNRWLNVSISALNLTDYTFWGMYAGLGIAVLVLAGIYPAIVVSGLQPLKAIRGEVYQRGKNMFSMRKGLIVGQFGISFILIAVSMVIILQSRYVKDMDLGMRKDLIMHMPVPAAEKGSVLVQQLSVLPGVRQVALFRTAPSSITGSGGSIRFENREWEKFVARSKVADDRYVPTYGLRLVAGRNLVASDTLKELLINQKLVKALGLASPEAALGRQLTVGDIGKTGTIVGVLGDFNNTDLYSGIEPTVVYQNKASYKNVAVALEGLNQATVDKIKAIWSAQFPDDVFEYRFFDEEIAKFYERETLGIRMTATFALLSIGLSCMGLFALAMFSIEQRKREIGVRKVLGASVASVSALVSVDFLKPVLIAIVLASPVAWYFMDRWLSDFAYRITLGSGVFLAPALLAVAVAWLTVGLQSIRAALVNPVQSLKTE